MGMNHHASQTRDKYSHDEKFLGAKGTVEKVTRRYFSNIVCLS